MKEYQPSSILEHLDTNDKKVPLKNEQFYIFSFFMASKLSLKCGTRLLMHRVPKTTKLINKTAADNAKEEMANGVQVVSQCHRQEEAAGPFVHLD